jgi:hypothetical protein
MLPERPRIAVSRSTVAGPGGSSLMNAVVAAAPGVDAEIVVVRPDRRVTRRGSLPGNVRTVGWVPAPRCWRPARASCTTAARVPFSAPWRRVYRSWWYRGAAMPAPERIVARLHALAADGSLAG